MITFATFPGALADDIGRAVFALQHLTRSSPLLSSWAMQPVRATASILPQQPKSLLAATGAMTITTLTVTTSPVRPVVFA